VTRCQNCQGSVRRRKYCTKFNRYLCKNCFGSRDYCNSCYGRLAYERGHYYERMLSHFYKRKLKRSKKRIIDSGINKRFRYNGGSFEIDIYFKIWGTWILIEAKDLTRPMNFDEVDKTVKTRFRLFRHYIDTRVIGIIESKSGYTRDAYLAAQHERYPLILAQNFIRKKRFGEAINDFNKEAGRNHFVTRLFGLNNYE